MVPKMKPVAMGFKPIATEPTRLGKILIKRLFKSYQHFQVNLAVYTCITGMIWAKGFAIFHPDGKERHKIAPADLVPQPGILTVDLFQLHLKQRYANRV